MQPIELNTLLQRLEKLESRQAFQEVTLEDLNQALIQQQQDIAKLQTSVIMLNEKLKAAQTSLMASPSEETPPPHY